MSFVIIDDNILVDVVPRYVTGSILTSLEAKILSSIWLKQFLTNLRCAIAEDMTLEQIQKLAGEVELTTELKVPQNDYDPVKREAKLISKERILARLSAENLPVPPNIEIHAEELARNDATILAIAKSRVEARLKAGLQMIQYQTTGD